MSIAQGTRLGQYEVQDFVGQGAMGLVYRAYHSQLERTGAVKVMQAITRLLLLQLRSSDLTPGRWHRQGRRD